MYLVQTRNLINGTCGAPVLAPSIEIAKRRVGLLISEDPVLKDHHDGAALDVLCEWDPETGCLSSFMGAVSQRAHLEDGSFTITGSECFASYARAFDLINTPGEGEYFAEDQDGK